MNVGVKPDYLDDHIRARYRAELWRIINTTHNLGSFVPVCRYIFAYLLTHVYTYVYGMDTIHIQNVHAYHPVVTLQMESTKPTKKYFFVMMIKTRQTEIVLRSLSLYPRSHPVFLTCRKGTGFLAAQLGKNVPANARDAEDVGSVPGSGRSPGRKRRFAPV